MIFQKIKSAFRTFVLALIPGAFFFRHLRPSKDPIQSLRRDIKLAFAVLFGIGAFALGAYLAFYVIPPLLLLSIGSLSTGLIQTACCIGLPLIAPEFGFLFGKYLIRGISYLRNLGNTNPDSPNSFHPTNPDRYRNESNKDSQMMLARLSQLKKAQKEEPNGCLGSLSTKQRKLCDDINYVVPFYRNNKQAEINSKDLNDYQLLNDLATAKPFVIN